MDSHRPTPRPARLYDPFGLCKRRASASREVGRGPVGEPTARVHRKRKRGVEAAAAVLGRDSQDSSSASSSPSDLEDLYCLHGHDSDEDDDAALSGIASKHERAHELAVSIVGVGEGCPAGPPADAFPKAAPRAHRLVAPEFSPGGSGHPDTDGDGYPCGFPVPPRHSPYWLYLMSIVDAEHVQQKTLTHVGKSRNPIEKVRMHNTRRVKSKSTRPAAGLWTLELAIGPVQHKEDTYVLRDYWKMKKRGPASRRDFGKWLGANLGLDCYDARADDDTDYLKAWEVSRKKRRRARRSSARAAAPART